MIYHLFVLLLVCAFNQPSADDVIGRFHAPDGVGKIEVYKRNGKYYGKAICCNMERKDIHNPNPELRNRTVVGLEFISDFEWDGKSAYRNGKLYYPQNGATYDCVMWLENNNNTLKVRGYVGVSMLGKTVAFERVQ